MSDEMQSRDPRPDGRPRTAPRKRRRRQNNGAALYVVFVIGLSALLAALGWVAANDVLALNKPEHSAVITLPEDIFTVRKETDADGKTRNISTADMGYVVDALKDKGLIQFKSVFRLYSAVSNASEKLAAGTYELDTDMDYRAIVTNMGAKSASRLTISVTIPEGYTVAQTFQLLEEKGANTVENLNEMAATYHYNFSFLQNIPLGNSNRLEGYLFPDTYSFYLMEDPKTIINKMLANFDRRFTDEMRKAAQEKDQTIEEILIVASMIEKETDGTDQARIASVIYNRLNNPGQGTNGLLNIDATIQYILPQRKAKLSAADLTIDNPYNTYLYPGLTPGPIANPGMAAINAAMNPESTGYYYYALGDDKTHHFFKTHGEQQNFTQSQKLYQNG